MKFSFFESLIVLSFVLMPTLVRAQKTSAYNLNVYNGLPSNHVYGMISDRQGYLWICTDKGLVRYNGYECKVYGLSNGLPTNDIWEPLEDKKGRIWLGNISEEAGYIYNNQYKKIHLKDITGTIYPVQLSCMGDGVSFQGPYLNEHATATLCFVDGDTIYKYIVSDSVFYPKQTDANSLNYLALNDAHGRPIYLYNNRIYYLSSSDGKTIKKTSELKMRLLSVLSDSDSRKYSGRKYIFVGDYLLLYGDFAKPHNVCVTHLESGTVRYHKLDIGTGNVINYIYVEKKENNDAIYIITNTTILKCKLDPNNKTAPDIFIEHIYKIEDLVNGNSINGNKVNTALYGNFWNYCIGTTSNGAWVNYFSSNITLKNIDINLNEYVSVGNNTSINFWWNKADKTLATIDDKKNIRYHKLGKVSRIYNIVHYAGDTFSACGDRDFLYVKSSGKILFPNNDNYIRYDIVFKNANEYLQITPEGLNNFSLVNNVASIKKVDRYRYKKLAYSILKKEYWAYSNNKIFIQNDEKSKILNREKLDRIGIKSLESVSIDSIYGNVFFKGHDNLIIYNHENDTRKELFSKIRFKDESSVHVCGNKLIVVWKYGILFSLILGEMQVSEPILYHNAKCVSYTTIYGSNVFNNTLYINTDRGVYTVDIPTDTQLLHNNNPQQNFYKFILLYANKMSNIQSNDTVMIDQDNRKLLFDVVHPLGDGYLQYYSSWSNAPAWQELNSNEVNLPESFQPDNYYKLNIYATDDSWKSDVIVLNLYIKPYWWQTQTMVRFIWVGISFLGLLVIATSIYLTRRLVLKAAQRRHLHMEMELKSIYAQINPHFIFNSLNSALLLVSKNRMDEAYSHIAKFSKLLRGYLKSSRNKYILISEEAENLKNYIELQQTRFKDKFVYQIIVGEAIKSGSVKIPSLLVQPFVENAINHGILQKEGQGNLKVEFQWMPDNTIVCIIEDDGIGRTQSKIINAANEDKSESYGDLMINDLVSIFNRYEKMNIDIVYTDKELPLTGTIVTITIKGQVL